MRWAILKTSKLICKIFQNEGEMDLSKLNNYIKQLLELEFLEIGEDKLSLKLTEKGQKYAE